MRRCKILEPSDPTSRTSQPGASYLKQILRNERKSNTMVYPKRWRKRTSEYLKESAFSWLWLQYVTHVIICLLYNFSFECIRLCMSCLFAWKTIVIMRLGEDSLCHRAVVRHKCSHAIPGLLFASTLDDVSMVCVCVKAVLWFEPEYLHYCDVGHLEDVASDLKL